jgi:hypothetical protein
MTPQKSLPVAVNMVASIKAGEDVVAREWFDPQFA